MVTLISVDLQNNNFLEVVFSPWWGNTPITYLVVISYLDFETLIIGHSWFDKPIASIPTVYCLFLCYRAKRYRAAKEGKNVQSSQQPSGSGIDKYFKVVAEKWCRTDKQQKALRSAVTNAVVMCSLPLSIVENEHFRAAFEVAQPRFNHIDRYVDELMYQQNVYQSIDFHMLRCWK